jgi:hypothetical protein
LSRSQQSITSRTANDIEETEILTPPWSVYGSSAYHTINVTPLVDCAEGLERHCCKLKCRFYVIFMAVIHWC